jgi:hypothetical protein
MKKLILAAVAAMALLGAPVLAQTVTVGADVGLNKDQRNAVRMEVTKPVGPVIASLELRSTLAKDKLGGKSELTAGVRYNSPIVLWGVTPFAKGELGVSSSAKNRSFWGAEVGGFGELDGPYSWEAWYRYRDPSNDKSENRYRATVFYDLDAATKVGGSVLVWNTNHRTTTGVGVDFTKKF